MKAIVTPRERFLITKFIEECSEAQKAACKLLNYGFNPEFEDKKYDNLTDLTTEIRHIQAVVLNFHDCGLIMKDDMQEAMYEKTTKYLMEASDYDK